MSGNFTRGPGHVVKLGASKIEGSAPLSASEINQVIENIVGGVKAKTKQVQITEALEAKKSYWLTTTAIPFQGSWIPHGREGGALVRNTETDEVSVYLYGGTVFEPLNQLAKLEK